MNKPEPLLYLSDARGIYIPRDFALETRHDCVTGVDLETWNILKQGPDHEWYWEAWTDVEQDATLTDPDTGVSYVLWQDGDLWLIPVGMEYDDSTGWFAWPRGEE